MQSNVLGRLLRLVTKSTVFPSRHVCQSCKRIITQRGITTTSSVSGVFEPDDLKLGPEIPEYEALNVQMRAYDFVVLESYAKYVHNLADSLGLETDVWPSPPKATQIDTYKPNSAVVLHTYNLNTYERTVQLQDVPSTILPIFLDVIRCHTPQGVNITLKEPDEQEEENRYIPDKELLDLQSQMDAIDQAREDRRKK